MSSYFVDNKSRAPKGYVLLPKTPRSTEPSSGNKPKANTRSPSICVRPLPEHVPPDGWGCQLPFHATQLNTKTCVVVEPSCTQFPWWVRPAVQPGGRQNVSQPTRGSLAFRKYDKPQLPVHCHAPCITVHDRSGPGWRREAKQAIPAAAG